MSLSFSACVFDDSDFLSFELLELDDFDDDDLCLSLSLSRLLDDVELLLWLLDDDDELLLCDFVWLLGDLELLCFEDDDDDLLLLELLCDDDDEELDFL